MDKLADQLRTDAERINVAASDDFDYRLEASLRGVTPEKGEPAASMPGSRPALFWWTSSLTGAAAAMVVIAIVNYNSQPDDPTTVATTPPANVPIVDLKAESAMLTEPLRQELENLQSDLRKAEEKVKQDIGL